MNNPFFANRHQPVLNSDQPPIAKPPGQLKSKWQPIAVPKKEEPVNPKQSVPEKKQTIAPTETPSTNRKGPEAPLPKVAEMSIAEKPLKATSATPRATTPPPAKAVVQPVEQPKEQKPMSESTVASQPDHSLGNEFRISVQSKINSSHTEETERRKSFISTGSIESPLPWKIFEMADQPKNSFLPLLNVSEKLDDMIMQLLVSQAVIDAKDFEVLTMEEVESLKEVKAQGTIAGLTGVILMILR